MNHQNLQIGNNKLLNGNEEINCFIESEKDVSKRKGKYKFKGSETLGRDNKFNLSSFENKEFKFYGDDEITRIFYNSFVTKAGSKMLFIHNYKGNDDSLPPIILYNEMELLTMTKCKHLKTSTSLTSRFGYCELTEKDIDFIKFYPRPLITYRGLCGQLVSVVFNIHFLYPDKPCFNIINFYKPENITRMDYRTRLLLTDNFSGSIKDYDNEGQFITIFEIENKNKNTSVMATCFATFPRNQEKANFTCSLDISDQIYIPVQNVYLLPYSALKNVKSIFFEAFIEKEIKANNAKIAPAPGPDPPEPPEPEPTISSYLVYSKIFITILLFLLF